MITALTVISLKSWEWCSCVVDSGVNHPPSVSREEPGGSLDFRFAGQKCLFERRRIRHGRVERPDDAHGRVQRFEGLLLDNRGDALADASSARVFVHDQNAIAVAGHR